jgi:dinuclear metal center YbgI/SA1388 family protein
MHDIYYINEYLKNLLDTNNINDYCINGIQVESSVSKINKIAFAVDASLESIEQTIKNKCSLLIVHHGILWNNIIPIAGNFKKRIGLLIEKNVGIIAYHLPLDRHHEYGNNIQIIKKIINSDHGKELKNYLSPFGYTKGINIGWQIQLENAITIEQIYEKLNFIDPGKNKFLAFGNKQIKRIAVMSGSGDRYFNEAVINKIDLYITGDSSHILFHEAKENNINILFAGHYYTELFGIKAIQKNIEQKFKIDTYFLDVPTGL